jgi:hypothetical protein
MSESVDRSSRMLFGEDAPNGLLAALIGCGFAAAFASASFFEFTPASANDRLATALLRFSPAMALEPLPPRRLKPRSRRPARRRPSRPSHPRPPDPPRRSRQMRRRNVSPDLTWTFRSTAQRLRRRPRLRKVEQVRRYADVHPDFKLIVEGYTDQPGAEAHNVVLAAYLSTHGASEKRILVRAAGAVGAAAPNASERDRHAHVRVVGVATCAAMAGAGETR